MTDIIWDIETKPCDGIDALWAAEEPAVRAAATAKHPGVFDESSVKYGNTKDEEKRAAKLADERAKHQQKLDEFAANVEADVEAARLAFIESSTLDARRSRVLTIGYLLDGEAKVYGADDDHQERVLLSTFWRCYRETANRGRLIGFNIKEFDLPFLIRRSWFHGITVPPLVRVPNLHNGRWWCDTFTDLRDVWRLGQYGDKGHSGGVNGLCAFFGLSPKHDGATFWKRFAENRDAAIQEHRDELEKIRTIAERLGVIRSEA